MANRNEIKNKYCPDYAIPPGETLLEIIRSKNISQSKLAEMMSLSKKIIGKIIKGKIEITSEMAIQIENIVEVPANFWITLERNYQSDLARIEEAKNIANQEEWLKNFPLKEIKNYGWIQKERNKALVIKCLLDFFCVANIEIWKQKWYRVTSSVLFCKSKAKEVNPYALATWLRKGEIDANTITTEKFNRERFRECLNEIRNLTTLAPDEFSYKMQKICASCGVILLFIPELPKMPVHGVTRWLSADNVLIQLSLYRKFDDQFWFSFFHEAGHVILHGKRDFVYDEINPSWDEEANTFAKNILIPKSAYEYFIKHNIGRFTSHIIQEFAISQNIAPSIVVGRLQHEKYIDFNQMNHLKRKFFWK